MGTVGRRVVQLAVVLLLVTIFTALLTSLIPGDPTVALGAASEEQQAQLREDLGLDEPLPVRYVDWLGDFVSGDFGNYYGHSTSTRPVYDAIRAALPVSLQLMVYAQVIALAVAIPLGVLTAYRAGTRLDRGVNTTAFALLAIPNFVLALLLSYYVGTKYGWLPPLGYTEFSEDPVDHIRRMILPAISLAAGQIAIYLRLLRSDMIATLQEGYIDTARAKGLPNRRILWRHAMRPSSLTLLTVAGLNVGALIGGALIIEVIFSLPGMGQLISEAIARRQYVALQSAVAVVAIGYVIVNLLVDILYGVLDPRVRHG